MRPDLIILPTFSAPVQDTCSFRALSACHVSDLCALSPECHRWGHRWGHCALSPGATVFFARIHKGAEIGSSVSGWRGYKICNSFNYIPLGRKSTTMATDDSLLKEMAGLFLGDLVTLFSPLLCQIRENDLLRYYGCLRKTTVRCNKGSNGDFAITDVSFF